MALAHPAGGGYIGASGRRRAGGPPSIASLSSRVVFESEIIIDLFLSRYADVRCTTLPVRFRINSRSAPGPTGGQSFPEV
jgi:hypothetical protein